jgi:carbon monoxide dehydrogenase subunit G
MRAIQPQDPQTNPAPCPECYPQVRMDVSASYAFAATPDQVWKLLNDPDVVASCLPGCERLEPIGDEHYKAELNLAIAAVTGRYTGTVALLDKRPPHSYRLVVQGKGSPGFVMGEATVELVEADGATIVRVTGQGQVGGPMARVGQRLLSTASKMMMDRFFGCLQAKATQVTLPVG